MDQTPAACEIERLPEDLLVRVISLTSPADAFRAAAVSRAFHAAADSDAVWASFLPRDLPRFAKKELPRRPPSTKKGLFRRLSDEPVLLPRKYMRMQLDKATGAKCFTISASAQKLSQFPSLVPVGSVFDYSKRGKRFLQATELGYTRRLKIHAKVQRKMLSQNTTYVAYMVFKLADTFYGYNFPFQRASFGVAGSESTREVCLQGYAEDVGAGEPPRKHVLPGTIRYGPTVTTTPGEDVVFPRRKAGGWMEVELGEFHNVEEGDGEVSISLVQKSTQSTCGLTVWGFELRCKQHIYASQLHDSS